MEELGSDGHLSRAALPDICISLSGKLDERHGDLTDVRTCPMELKQHDPALISPSIGFVPDRPDDRAVRIPVLGEDKH
jgi:hypothetical protein